MTSDTWLLESIHASVTKQGEGLAVLQESVSNLETEVSELKQDISRNLTKISTLEEKLNLYKWAWKGTGFLIAVALFLTGKIGYNEITMMSKFITGGQ